MKRAAAIGTALAVTCGVVSVLAASDAGAQSVATGPAARPDGAAVYLSGPSNRDPLAIARDEAARSVRSHASAATAMSEEHRVESVFTTQRTGTTHIWLRQYLNGTRVWNGDFAAHVDRDGRLIAAHNRLRGARWSQNGDAPRLRADEAVARAAREVGQVGFGAFTVLEDPDGSGVKLLLDPGGISQDPIPAELVYVRDPDELLWLAWNIVIREIDGRHWWEMNIDAATGEILTQSDYVAHDSYRVFPYPTRNPDDGPHTLVFDPSDLTASPLAWHDLDGMAGADSQLTMGNNADVAHGVTTFRPSGGAGLDFDFALNLNQLTSEAPITNTFYWVNWLHDVHYQYGFDESSGNFQRVGYVGGGSGNDEVVADIQDPTEVGNASFATPRDGVSPSMRMGIFNDESAILTIELPADIAQDIEASGAEFGPSLSSGSVAGTLVAALDVDEGEGFTTTDACSALTNAAAIAGNIALVDRGECLFVEKAAIAQAAGAVAVIIANNVAGAPILMGGTDPTINIPAAMITQQAGQLLRANLARGVTGTLSSVGGPDRDSAYDTEIIIHEFGHGVTNRLTGGPAAVTCLDTGQSQALGEGWSDFWAVALLTLDSHAPGDARGIGTFVLSQPLTGTGLRNFPYSSDLAINPLTYAAIANENTNLPHGAGEVWAVALLDMYWNLVADHGFDPDVTLGTGGNNMALELVMDALKLQPCNPNYLQARDAILQADLVSHASANSCAIWEAFAKRGLGVDADSPNGSSIDGVVEDFSVPPMCVPEPALWIAQCAGVLAVAGLRRRRRLR